MTFKRHYHEDGLTEAHYDLLLPVADPITVLPTTPSSKQHQGSLTITIETQTGTTYQTPSSLTKVFDVVELAEQILLQLPPENLLCKVQRVCRRWHELVRDSKLIQEYLFFKPISPKTTYGWATEVHPWTGLLESYWTIIKATPSHYIENPWLYLFSEATPPTPGSWQRMFVTQPPIPYLRYSTLQDYDEFNRKPVRVRLGDMFQRVWNGRMGAWDSRATPKDMKLTELYIAQGWGRDWKPVAGWETIQSMKKEIRFNEKFLELEIAYDMDQD